MSFKTITICDDPRGPVTLDPQKQFEMVSQNMVGLIYDMLVRFSLDGKIEPCLACEWERLDPLRMRFKLRKGVLFHNMEKFDARSVKFSFDRVLSWLTMAPAKTMLNTIRGVEIVNDDTVDVVTKIPDGTLLNKLATFGHIIPPGYFKKVKGRGLANHPVGTGPYKFVSWVKGEQLVFEKNENYWMQGFPKIDRLVFKFIPINQQTDALLKGELDMVTYLQEKDTFKVQANPSTRVQKDRCLIALGAPFNLSKDPFRDKRVRQALNYATNKEDILKYAVFGNGKVLQSIAMPGETGYVDLSPYPYDPQKARDLLKEAGYAKGLKIKLLVRDIVEDVGRMAMKQWEEVGIKAECEVLDQETLFRKLALPMFLPFLPRVKGDVFISHCPDYACHIYFITGFTTLSRGLYGLGGNAEFDRRYNEMIAQVEPKAHARLAQELDRFLYDEALMLFICQLYKVIGIRKGVNFQPHITGSFDFRSLSLEGAQ